MVSSVFVNSWLVQGLTSPKARNFLGTVSYTEALKQNFFSLLAPKTSVGTECEQALCSQLRGHPKEVVSIYTWNYKCFAYFSPTAKHTILWKIMSLGKYPVTLLLVLGLGFRLFCPGSRCGRVCGEPSNKRTSKLRAKNLVVLELFVVYSVEVCNTCCLIWDALFNSILVFWSSASPVVLRVLTNKVVCYWLASFLWVWHKTLCHPSQTILQELYLSLAPLERNVCCRATCAKQKISDSCWRFLPFKRDMGFWHSIHCQHGNCRLVTKDFVDDTTDINANQTLLPDHELVMEAVSDCKGDAPGAYSEAIWQWSTYSDSLIGGIGEGKHLFHVLVQRAFRLLQCNHTSGWCIQCLFNAFSELLYVGFGRDL